MSSSSAASGQQPDGALKLRTARSMKWNVIDRVSSQVLYAVTGIVLARELSQADFGLVGAVLIFQAFATLLVDSGFSNALIQRKAPTRLDYSSVLWFNMLVAIGLYVLLWFAAPLIADCFEGDRRLIPLSRVMFISFVLNASAIVQTNRFMKQMNVRPVAMSNAIALTAGAAVGIWLAMAGYGAWAIVWQTITTNGVKSLILWIVSRWTPLFRMSWQSLRSFMNVGVGLLLSSFLNLVFLNINSFFIGNRVGLVSLGYYTQSDKWSKMGITSISGIFASTFVPALAAVQDDAPRFKRMVGKMNRMTSYLMFPALLGLAIVATPVFHTLFGEKWDPSIILFQLLLVRGVLVVLTSLYSNYLLALGFAAKIVHIEIFKDVVALIALVATFPVMAMTLPDDPVYGLTIMLWAQLGASVAAWVYALAVTSSATGIKWALFLKDCAPYLFLTLGMCCCIAPIMLSGFPAIVQLVIMVIGGGALYLGVNFFAGSKIQDDMIAYLRGKL